MYPNELYVNEWFLAIMIISSVAFLERKYCYFFGRFSFNVSGADTKFGPFFFNITVLKVTVSMKIAPIILRNGSTQVVLSTNFITVHYSGLENVKSSEIQVVVLQSFAHFEFLYR